MLTPVPERPDLYRWQFDALVAWLRCGRRGVIEAVTGSGKTDVALAAVEDALRRDKFVLVLVPTRVLMEQWHRRLVARLPEARIGRLGDTGRDQPEDCDVLIATRHSAATHRPAPPEGRAGGLLVADECHGLGGAVLRKALVSAYDERLGLTATLERSDDAVTDLLLPFFGGICFRYGFGEAIADGVCARPRVALIGVPLSIEERADYIATEQQLVDARHHLRRVKGLPLEPFGDFLAAVGHLAQADAGPDGRAARDYLDAFGKRRQIVAQSIAKYELLGDFAPTIREAEGAVLFTETVRAANHAINRLDPLVAIDLITGATARRHRTLILDDLRARRLDAVAAPRVLDEGVDVPDANLGIVLSASRTRRQMIQRMGRILRRKRPGVAARFVIVFARDTMEDPAARVDRDGFLDELEQIAEALAVFASDDFAPAAEFLAQPGPACVPDPVRLADIHAALAPLGVQTALVDQAGADRAGVDRDGAGPAAPGPGGPHGLGGDASPGDADGPTADAAIEELVQRFDAETVYAYAAYVLGDGGPPGSPAGEAPLEAARPMPADPPGAVSLATRAHELLGPRLLTHDADEPALPEVPYLEPELAPLPEIGQPRTTPRRLSTGEAPLVIRPAGRQWQLVCTGCGAASSTVQFRWQALEQTVDCRCG